MRKAGGPVVVVFLVSLGAATSGCGDGGALLPSCASDADCRAGEACVSSYCLPRTDTGVPSVEDLRAPVDLSVSMGDQAIAFDASLPPAPDLASPPPDLTMDAGCSAGQKLCGIRCIPDVQCCVNADCMVVGQVCQNDGTCACAVGAKVCGGACIPQNSCCTDADCPMTACAGGTCQPPSCFDGIANNNEPDIDCGALCGKCLSGRACKVPGDCRSNVCTAGKCATPGFQTATWGGAAMPVFLANADLNGDGNVDIVTANTTSNNVSVLLGRGDGSFTVQGAFATGLGPAMVVTADFNEDGKPDVAAVDKTSRDVAVLLGKGDGNLGTATMVPVSAQPGFLAAADFDGDGHLDLAVAATTLGRIYLLAGKGNGTFGAPQTFSTDIGPAWLAAADLDGDKLVDLAVANTNALSVGLLLGRGKAPLASATSFKLNNNPPRSTAVADLDSDGLLDVLVGGTGVTLLRGQGNGAFVIGATFGNSFSTFLTVTDLDGNNLPDVLGSQGSQLGGMNGMLANAVGFPGFPLAGHAVAADYNRDGKMDVALVVAASNVVSVLFGNGDGTLAPIKPGMSGSLTDVSQYRPQGLACADFNEDGRADALVTSSQDQSINFYFPDAMGVLPTQPVNFPTFGAGPRNITTSDLNADGHLDVVVADSGDTQYSVLLGSGNGNISKAGNYPTGGTVLTSYAAGDVTGDKKIDLVGVGSGSNNVAIFAGNGDGTFAAKPVLYGTGTAPVWVTLADLSGDGALDIVTANSNSSNATLLVNDGNGAFNAVRTLMLANQFSRPTAVAVADLDGDNKPDILVSESVNSTVVVLLGKNNLNQPVAYTVGRGAAALAVADFTRDGKPDVLTANSLDATVSLLAGVGDGSFQAAVHYDAGNGPFGVAAGDLNGDKRPDAVISNSTSNTLTVLHNGF